MIPGNGPEVEPVLPGQGPTSGLRSNGGGALSPDDEPFYTMSVGRSEDQWKFFAWRYRIDT